jgi:hypothetical protein
MKSGSCVSGNSLSAALKTTNQVRARLSTPTRRFSTSKATGKEGRKRRVVSLPKGHARNPDTKLRRRPSTRDNRAR